MENYKIYSVLKECMGALEELDRAQPVLEKLIGFFGTADYDEILPQMDRILENAEVYDGPCPPMPKGE